jgi:hypothetical protein
LLFTRSKPFIAYDKLKYPDRSNIAKSAQLAQGTKDVESRAFPVGEFDQAFGTTGSIQKLLSGIMLPSAFRKGFF